MSAQATPVTVEELLEYVSSQIVLANERAAKDGRDVLRLTGCTLTVSYTVHRNQGGSLDLRVVGGTKGSDAEAMNSIEITLAPSRDLAFPAQSGGSGASSVPPAEPLGDEAGR